MLAALKGPILESLKQLAESLDWTMEDGEENQEIKDMIGAKKAEFEALADGMLVLFSERVTLEQAAGDTAAEDARLALEEQIEQTKGLLEDAWKAAAESFET